jgi:hypothetical protein
MKNKLLLSLSTILCLTGSSLQAQISLSERPVSQSDAQAVKNTKLVVVLMEENEDYVEKMRRKNKTYELQRYSNTVRNYNTQINELVKEFFPFVKNVDFKSLSEIKEMPKEERQTINFLAYNIGMSVNISDMTANVPAYDFYGKSVSSPIDNKSFDFEDRDATYSKLEIYTYAKKESGKYKIIFLKTLPNIVPSTGDVAYWLKRANFAFSDVADHGDKAAWKRKIEENTKQLKQKTLLICKDNLDKSTTAVSIKKVYPYPFKVVSKEEFDRAILAKENDKCVLVPLRMDGPMVLYIQELIDLQSGSFVAMGTARAVVQGAGGSAYREVQDSHMKKYAESVQ